MRPHEFSLHFYNADGSKGEFRQQFDALTPQAQSILDLLSKLATVTDHGPASLYLDSLRAEYPHEVEGIVTMSQLG